MIILHPNKKIFDKVMKETSMLMDILTGSRCRRLKAS